MRHVIVAIAVAIIIIPTAAWAKPPKGFHTGPYLAIEAGFNMNDFDRNQRTGEKVGTKVEPSLGFLFGWNIYDWFSAEMSGRYSTSEKNDRREHIANVHFNAKFFLITDALTNFPTLRILPFAQIGPALNVAVLPNDASAVNSDTSRTSIAYGPSVGAGVMFLFKKYVYLGVKGEGDFLFYDDIRSSIDTNGAVTPGVLIYRGGFIPQFSATAMAGVHF